MPLKNRLCMLQTMLLGLLMAVLGGCDSSMAADQVMVIKPVKLFEIPNLKGAEHDAFLAEVDAGNRSHLSFQVSGVIEQLNVRQGQRVKKGDILIALDPKDFQLAVDEAQAKFEFYQTSLQRDQQLFKKKLISLNTLDKSETDYKTALANLEQAQTELSYSKIHAPFDGVISLSFVKKYQFINAKETVLNIINTDNLDINISLPVPYVDQVGLANLKQFDFSVSFDFNNEIMFPARFKEMSTQPDLDTNSYSTTVQIKRPDAMNILIGMTGQVFIFHEITKPKLQLPADAWKSKSENAGTVWRFNPADNSVYLITVTTDGSGNVISGLNAGDLIVIAGLEELNEGQIVRPWKREEGI